MLQLISWNNTVLGRRLRFNSLRAKNKEDRKICQDNGYHVPFLTVVDDREGGWRMPEYDTSALINVIRRLKPAVIVDESHNVETTLFVEMPQNLNPRFILDLTATPKKNSNVDALALKRHHMVKLPIIVAKRWESKAGAASKYMIVIDNNPIDGPECLTDALKKLSQY